jgi:hypothetical protein
LTGAIVISRPGRLRSVLGVVVVICRFRFHNALRIQVLDQGLERPLLRQYVFWLNLLIKMGGHT